jgi:oxygen-independent coproporphyrinogen-3 oxidase
MAGIYIHIPFCKQACYYCDFHFSTSLKKKEEMLNAIKTELRLRKGEIIDEVKTIYFGGGTPSLLGKTEIQELLDVIKKNYRLSDNPEITLEANPDDLDHIKILELADSPVNRLSIGIQSFFDEDLKFMNRAHDEIQAKESLILASRYFENISVDLIYGIPHLSEQRWRDNLRQTFDFGVAHISSYALTVEPKTALDHFIRSGKYPPIDESLAQSHFEILKKETGQRGYIQYEISNFGLEGYFSMHNTSYWKGDYYIGVGPSAHSYDGRSRSWNISNNTKYVTSIQKGEFPSEKENLSTEDRINEDIMTGLRTIWGVSLERIESSYGEQYKIKILEQAEKHLDRGTLELENDQLFITEKGQFLADGISADLFILKS